MKTKYRYNGMIACLILAILALLLVMTPDPMLQDFAMIVVMFVGGYGLRETLDHLGDGNNDTE